MRDGDNLFSLRIPTQHRPSLNGKIGIVMWVWELGLDVYIYIYIYYYERSTDGSPSWKTVSRLSYAPQWNDGRESICKQLPNYQLSCWQCQTRCLA